MRWRVDGVCLPILLCAAGCGGGGECETGAYPPSPQGATGVVHVSAGCPADEADGSAEHPFPQISQATAAAAPGNAVLVRGATYRENLVIDRPLSIVGPSGGDRGELAGIILQAPAPNAVTIVNAPGTLLRGLHVDGATRAGVVVKGSSVTIESSRITDTGADPTAHDLGYGIAASENSEIILQHSAVTGSASTGVLLFGSHGIILQNEISDNEAGAVRLDHADVETRVEGNTMTGNAAYGVGVFTAKAIILQNTIRDVRLGSGDLDAIGYGIVSSGEQATLAASIEVRENTISNSSRVAVLCAKNTRTIILQDNAVEGSALSAEFGAGIWLQQGAGGDAANHITHNRVAGNKFVGVGLTGDTHGIILQDNDVTGTVLGTTFVNAQDMAVGDGIGLFATASAQITGNRIVSNARIGIVFDAAGAGTITSANTVQQNQFGVVQQNQSAFVDLGADTIQGNTTDTQSIPLGGVTKPVRSDEFATRLPN